MHNNARLNTARVVNKYLQGVESAHLQKEKQIVFLNPYIEHNNGNFLGIGSYFQSLLTNLN